MSTYPPQAVRFETLGPGSLERLLDLRPPAGVSAATAFKQLRRIEGYLLANEVGAQCVVVEEHYIDRDFMEDISVFYSRSLRPVNNFCKRLHFFRGDSLRVKKQVQRLTRLGQKVKEGLLKVEAYRAACHRFSAKSYCGFSVIKPLAGTPVGRTVLVPFPNHPRGRPFSRMFTVRQLSTGRTSSGWS